MLGWQDDRLLKDVLPAKDAAKIKKAEIGVGKNVEKSEPLYIVSGKVNIIGC